MKTKISSNLLISVVRKSWETPKFKIKGSIITLLIAFFALKDTAASLTSVRNHKQAKWGFPSSNSLNLETK